METQEQCLKFQQNVINDVILVNFEETSPICSGVSSIDLEQVNADSGGEKRKKWKMVAFFIVLSCHFHNNMILIIKAVARICSLRQTCPKNFHN